MTWLLNFQGGTTAEKGLRMMETAVLLFVLHYALSALYNVTLHPLAKFPGPKAAAMSQIPYASKIVRGKLPYWVKGLHERYKCDIVRTSPTELSFINASAWQDINGHRTGHRDFERDLAVYGRPPNKVHSILTAPRADHMRMRRVLEHAFSVAAFQEQESIVLEYTDKLIRCLHKEVECSDANTVDVVRWYNWMSFDTIGDLAFGESFNCLQDQALHPWVETIFGNLKGISLMGACNRFPLIKHLLPLLIPRRVHKMIADHWAYTTEKLSRRVKLEKDRPDFMSPILNNNVDGKGLRQEEILPNASLFVVAGSKSVATNLSGATYFLLKNPRIMNKLQGEVRSTFKTDAEITVQHVAQLQYLQAILSETNRIYPTALTGQACVVPPEGDTVSGVLIPGNTGVSINQYAAYLSSTNFLDADSFVPERWLSDPRYVADNRDVFHPFSYGPRNCIGRILGEAETRLVLAKMIFHFDMQLCLETESEGPWLDQQVFLSWQKKPLYVRLTRATGLESQASP